MSNNIITSGTVKYEDGWNKSDKMEVSNERQQTQTVGIYNDL